MSSTPTPPFSAKMPLGSDRTSSAPYSSVSSRAMLAETLPSVGVRFQLADRHQLFANVAKNFKAPGNFIWSGAIVGGVNRVEAINDAIRAETSVNLDAGYRHFGEAFTFSGTVFAVDYKDRLARQFDANEGITLDRNVGDATVRGFELDNRFNYRRDGLPINAETSIPLDNKAQVEVLKGTSGIQAGTSAVELHVLRPPSFEELGRVLRLRSSRIDRQRAARVGERVDRHRGVLARFDDLVEFGELDLRVPLQRLGHGNFACLRRQGDDDARQREGDQFEFHGVS